MSTNYEIIMTVAGQMKGKLWAYCLIFLNFF